MFTAVYCHLLYFVPTSVLFYATFWMLHINANQQFSVYKHLETLIWDIAHAIPVFV